MTFVHNRTNCVVFFSFIWRRSHILYKHCQDVKYVLMLYSLIAVCSAQFIQQFVFSSAAFEVVFQ